MLLFTCTEGCWCLRLQVRLYEVLREGVTAPSAAESPVHDDNDGLRLVQRRRISARRPGWEVFKLRNVIQRWLHDPSTNRGVLDLELVIFYSMALRHTCQYVCLSVTLVNGVETVTKLFHHNSSRNICFPIQNIIAKFWRVTWALNRACK